jgi:tetratricopeptide (TPR) repeat protein
MGYCLWRQGQYEEAAARYKQAMQLDSRNATAWAGFGVVRMTQHLNEPGNVAYRDEALEAWHRSLEIDSRQAKLRALRDKYQPKTAAPPLQFDVLSDMR